MKKINFALILGLAVVLLAGCKKEPAVVADNWTMTPDTGWIYENGRIVISDLGEYTISGRFTGTILNNIADTVLILNGAELKNNEGNAVIYSEYKMEIKAAEDTTNYITQKGTECTDGSKAAVYAGDNLDLGGKGTCYISGTVQHGVKGKEDVKLKGAGIYYISGVPGSADDSEAGGSAINCKNLKTKAGDPDPENPDAPIPSFTVYLQNSKNGIKAQYWVEISCGTFEIKNNMWGIKTDSEKSKKDKCPKIEVTGGKVNFKNNSTADYESSYINEGVPASDITFADGTMTTDNPKA